MDIDFKERQTKKMGKRDCVLCKTGAGENSEKGRKPDNVAALKQNIIIWLVNRLPL